MYLKKRHLLHAEILSPLLVIPGLKNNSFPPVDDGFLSPEMGLDHVKLLLEQLVWQ